MTNVWRVRLDKDRSTWSYYTENPQGGGFGSNHCGARRVALNVAVRNIPALATYILTINGESETLVRGSEPEKFKLDPPRPSCPKQLPGVDHRWIGYVERNPYRRGTECGDCGYRAS